MIATENRLPVKAAWKQGYRIHPELRKLLKSAAALRGMKTEDLAHEILCRALDRPDLIDEARAASE